MQFIMRKLFSKFPDRHRTGRLRLPDSGQSLVEFSLVLPIILLIMVGVVDLGRAYFAYMTVVNVAQEGARYGAANPNAKDIDTHAQNEAQGSGVNSAQLTVSHSFPNGCVPGNTIQVDVTYNFQFITAYIFGVNTIPLRASDRMMVLDKCF
jgi:Flp pilus assembly protein TadG